MSSAPPKLYNELADWYHLLTAPSDYTEEAGCYRALIERYGGGGVETLLELGSGGGANASHLKAHYRMTLTDLSDAMLRQSRKVNPELEHLVGDMRTMRLDRTYDALLIHDAIDYMTNETDLAAALATAAAHLRRDGVALFLPDHIKDTFEESSDHGGGNGELGRALRYLEWTWDPDPGDETYTWDFVYMLRETSGGVEVVHDRHICGLFSTETWFRLMADAGFEATYENVAHSEVAEGLNAFIGRKR